MASPKDESSSEMALRNKLILQNIFEYIPTKFLVSSCSLVNKTWNTEARKLIRDTRKCTTKNDWADTACRHLQRFDELCGQIAENGRIVPFNSLKLGLSQECHDGSCRLIFYSNLISNSDIKLKYLEVFSKDEYVKVYCPIHKPLRVLLERKSGELRCLKMNSIGFVDFFHFTAPNWKPQFPQLEKLDITWVRFPEGELPGPLWHYPMHWLLKNEECSKIKENCNRLPINCKNLA